MKESKCKWVRLGDYITQRREKNNNYDVPIYGVTREGFIPPKQKEADTKLYNTFYLNDFVFNPARMEINSIYLNDFCDKAICSSLYEIFFINDTNVLLPHYLHLFLKREEFARQCEYIGHGSAREYCRINDISDIQIPLPSLEDQKKVVNAWKALREIKEQNEAIAAPLMQVCQSYIQELKHKYESVEIGQYIIPCDERNCENKDLPIVGINIDKMFMPTAANTEGVKTKNYKVMKKGRFVFSGMQTGRDQCIRTGLYSYDYDSLVSPAYTTYTIDEGKGLLSGYFDLIFKRKEMDRLGAFYSDASVRANLEWSRFLQIRIPIPPLDVQQSIVNLYNCANEAKKIAEEADKKSREICPALIQYVINKEQ